MANWSNLKSSISSVIKTNANQEITGQVLQNVLNNIVSSVGENSTFAGIATPTTNPGVPDGNVFYLATAPGTYSNFGGIQIVDGEAVILEWRGSWVKKTTGFATQKQFSELEQYTNKGMIYHTISSIGKDYKMPLDKNETYVIILPYLKNELISLTLGIGDDERYSVYLNEKNPLITKEFTTTRDYKGIRIYIRGINGNIVPVYVGKKNDFITQYSNTLNNQGLCRAFSIGKIGGNITNYINVPENRTGVYLPRNLDYKGQAIYGVDLYARANGISIDIYKGTNIGENNFSETLLEAFKVKKGWNRLFFSQPLNLEENESIGVKTGSSVGYVNNGDIGFEYANITNGAYTWTRGPETMLFFPLVYGEEKFLKEEDYKKDFKSINASISDINKSISDIKNSSYLLPLFVLTNITENKINKLYIPSNRTAIYIPTKNSELYNNTIYGISFYALSDTNVTIYKGTNIGTNDFTEELIATIPSNIGWNTYSFDNPINLAENESIGTRTINVGWIANGGINMQYGELSDDTYQWITPINSMLFIPLVYGCGQIAKNREDIAKIKEELSQNPLNGKRLSIIGDSISTFKTKIPEGNAAYYPSGNVNSYEKTWSGILIEKTGMVLDTLEAWSGSRVSTTGTASFTSQSRWGNLGTPDIIIVFGGINDVWQTNPAELGEIPDIFTTSEDAFDLTKFAQSYTYLLIKLKKTYPNAKIFACSVFDFARTPIGTQGTNGTAYWKNEKGWGKQDLRDTVEKICNLVGVHFIDLFTKSGISFYNIYPNLCVDDGLHLNYIGMQLIAQAIYKEI